MKKQPRAYSAPMFSGFYVVDGKAGGQPAVVVRYERYAYTEGDGPDMIRGDIAVPFERAAGLLAMGWLAYALLDSMARVLDRAKEIADAQNESEGKNKDIVK